MTRRTPLIQQRWLWTGAMAVAAIAFWIVGLGVGWRAWLIAPDDSGIVAHAHAFGVDASVYWIPATVLSLTVAVMAIGVALVRHLVDPPLAAEPDTSSSDDEPLLELPSAEPTDVGEAVDEEADEKVDDNADEAADGEAESTSTLMGSSTDD